MFRALETGVPAGKLKRDHIQKIELTKRANSHKQDKCVKKKLAFSYAKSLKMSHFNSNKNYSIPRNTLKKYVRSARDQLVEAASPAPEDPI